MMRENPKPKSSRDCLAREQLFAFSIGALPAELCEAVAGHIEGCGKCLEVLRTLDDNVDPVIAAARKPVPLELFSEAAAPTPPFLQGPFPKGGELADAVEREGALSEHSSSPPEAMPDTTPETEPYRPGASPVQAGGMENRPFAFIGKYRIVEKLGEGGQAEVFRAVHPVLRGRDVVIKLAKHRLPEALHQQLLHEGQALARLEDVGVARVYDVDVHESRPFLVMEHIAGRTLRDQFKERRPAPQEAAALVAQLARTLAKVHGLGVLHRDLKPANILLDVSGRPRIVDFGLALMAQPWAEARSPEGQVSGTFQYMAPEQAEGQSDRIGPRTDIFGLGAVLYELLTGQAPYQGATKTDVWEQARQAKVVRPRSVNVRVPRSLERICLKALAADPNARYTTAGEMERALRSFLRRPHLLATVALAVVVLLVALLVRWLLPGQAVMPEPAVLKEMTVYVRRGDDGLYYRKLVTNGRELETEPIKPPLSPKDIFQLVGAFEQPTLWYLVWFDTRGQVTVAANSDVPQAEVEYPIGQEMVSVNPDDPPGVHALVLIAGRGSGTEGAERLERAFHGIDPPPTPLPERWAVQRRGPGGTRAAPSNLYPSKYLQAIQDRMPAGLELVFVLFLETEK